MLASRCFAAALIAASLTLAPVALAEDVAAAKALFQEGLEHMQAGAFDKGCPALRESYRLDPRIGTLFTLAECEAKWGRIATAVAHYSNFLTQVAAMPSGQRIKQREREKVAREKRDELTPQVPELTLVLPKEAPANTVVTRDGERLRTPSLGVALPIDPGEHVVTTQVPGGGKLVEQKFEIEKGEKKTVTLEFVLPEKGADTGGGSGDGSGGQTGGTGGPGADGGGGEQGTSTRRLTTYILGGVGIAGLAAGGVFGGLTLMKKNDLQAEHDADEGRAGCNFSENKCFGAGADGLGQAKVFGWISTAAFGVGAVSLGVATVLLLTDSSGSAPEQTGKSKPVRRAWVRPGVLAAGQDGAVLGVQGAW